MIRYALGRLVVAVPVLLAVATLTFGLLRFLPGGPFDREKALPPEILRNIEARYALDQPLWTQYTRYLGGLLRGDLGPSYKYVGRDVASVLAEALPVSAQLGGVALLIALGGGVAIGLAAGTREGFPYSAALREADFIWTPRALDAWLAQPGRFLPGNRMTFAGVMRQDDRDALIAYLLEATTAESPQGVD